VCQRLVVFFFFAMGARGYAVGRGTYGLAVGLLFHDCFACCCFFGALLLLFFKLGL